MQMLEWVLLGAGAAALVGFWAYYLVWGALTAAPLIVRLGMAAVVVGVAFLLASVIQDRLLAAADEYLKELA